MISLPFPFFPFFLFSYHQGVLCGTCAAGFHNTGSLCTVCQGPTQYAILIVIVVGALALGLFYYISIKLDTSKLVNGAKVAVSCMIY